MATDYCDLPAARLQEVLSRIEAQSPGVPFHTLCVLAAESYWGREFRLTPGLVRLRVLGDNLRTACGTPPKVTLATLDARLATAPRRPLCVSYGMGVDSTAVLVHLARMYERGKRPAYRPDVITFADTGNEKKETYAYLPVINAYLRSMGFPEVAVVKYVPTWTKNGEYHTLEQNCLVNKTLPSLAFGFKKCSLKWKRGPQDKYRAAQKVCRDAWEAGLTGIVCIGYDAGPKDSCRAWDIENDEHYEYCYPLMDLGWDRDRCLAEIRAEGLPGWEHDRGGRWVERGGVPTKSACWYCPATQPEELVEYAKTPHGQEYLRAIVRMEANAAPNLTKIEGLWRNGTKGTRGGKPRPGAMTKFITDNHLLTERRPLPLAGQYTFDAAEQVVGVPQ